jgi:hypothetical protein
VSWLTCNVRRSNSNENGGSRDGSSSGNGTGSLKSACRDTVCPQILSADTIGTPPQLYLFARGTDNAIWYANAPATSISSWQNNAWKSLGGPFLSQPTAATWNVSTKLSVFAVADPDRSVRTKIISSTGSTWPASWENLSSRSNSPVSVCVINNTRIDLWITTQDSSTTTHNYWQMDQNVWSSSTTGNNWQNTVDFGKAIGAAPGIVCRRNLNYHDIVVYGKEDKAVMHSTYNEPSQWTLPNGKGGKFLSNPVLLYTSDDRFDFFGIGTDKAMYHFSWSTTQGYSSLENLGGSFASVPSVVATRSERIDVIALGTNDVLHHRVLEGSQWSDWEELPVYGNSAPLLVDLKVEPKQLGIFVLGTNGEINQTTWPVSSDKTWKNLQWKSIGGKMTASFYGV